MTDDLAKRLDETLGGVSPPVFRDDNLAIVFCTAFDDPDDDDPDENGWTAAATDGCEQALQAIRDHYAPLADRIAELEAKLSKVVEIAELFSGGVEYDYHGNIIGDEERKAMKELEKLTGGKDD